MQNIAFAMRSIVPLVFSYVFVGLAYGAMAYNAGYSLLWIGMSSFFIYAGSMQLVMIPLMIAGTPLYMLALMTLFINGRHMFYGLGFLERFKTMGTLYPYMCVTITDETYSVLCSIDKYPGGVSPGWVDFYILFMSHMLWVISTVAGAWAVDVLTIDVRGIDFSATAFFVTVCVNQWRQFGSHIPAVAGLVSALTFYWLIGPDKFLIPALAVSLLVLMVMRDRISMQMRRAANDG